MTDAVQPRRTPLPLPSQWPVAIGALLATSYGVGFLAGYGWQFGVLFVIGGLLGMSLYQAEFGFTAAYRNAMVRRDVAGVRAQVLMVVLAVLIFAPTLAGGVSASGIRAVGALAPTGWEVAVGSFVFGIGMQLASGCGSGTLFTVGGGSTRMVVTLIFFCIGAFLATLAWDWDALVWLRARSTPVSLGGTFGWGVATVGQVALLGAIWLGLGRWGRGRDQKPIWTGLTWRRLLSGPWPLLFSGILMALLNWTILELTGHAWSITWGFTLWAAEAAQLLGWEPQSSVFWAHQANVLARGILFDHTSITNVGIILGALIGAGFAGRFEPTLKIPAKSLLAAVIGGLLLGIGARMAYGCNIGAFFSGVASGSLHGWVWILFALPGNWIGVQMRPWFGLEK
jgi:uncharacterized membrane protein YedE/YeeE